MNITSQASQVCLKAKFYFPSSTSPDIEHTFDESNCKVSLIGLPSDVEPEKVRNRYAMHIIYCKEKDKIMLSLNMSCFCFLKPKEGDYNYSGCHDHDKLPKPKEGGEFALLIDMVYEAKKSSDELLTRIINEENRSDSGTKRFTKKQKLTEND